MNENREQFTENKIIILYILNEIALPVTNLQLTEILTGRAFMRYFSQQEALSDLLETGLLKEYSDETGHTFLVITEEGKDAVKTLGGIIPSAIKQNFDINKQSVKDTVKRDWEINATTHIDENDNHYVRCYVRDGDTFLIDIKILAGNKKLASKMGVQWKKDTEKIYSDIISRLLSDL